LTCRDAVDFHENVFLAKLWWRISTLRRGESSFSSARILDISGTVWETQRPMTRRQKPSSTTRVQVFPDQRPDEQSEDISQFAVGLKKVGGREGTYKDAEDGALSGNTIAQGSVDSVLSLALDLEGHGSGKACYWICAGESWTEVRRINALVRHNIPLCSSSGPETIGDSGPARSLRPTPCSPGDPETLSPQPSGSEHTARLAGRDPGRE